MGKPATPCPICGDGDLDLANYAELLGFYLGDGHIARVSRAFALRVSCDTAYPAIIEDVEKLLALANPMSPVFRIANQGSILVQSSWKHWPCVFPQHGPGKKHQRHLVMEAWQRDVVQKFPGRFLRGLFHSDGCRAKNWAKPRADSPRYEYPRWHFSNESREIMLWCRQALDSVDIAWRQSRPNMLSVSRKEAVEALDSLIGFKT